MQKNKNLESSIKNKNIAGQNVAVTYTDYILNSVEENVCIPTTKIHLSVHTLRLSLNCFICPPQLCDLHASSSQHLSFPAPLSASS